MVVTGSLIGRESVNWTAGASTRSNSAIATALLALRPDTVIHKIAPVVIVTSKTTNCISFANLAPTQYKSRVRIPPITIIDRALIPVGEILSIG